MDRVVTRDTIAAALRETLATPNELDRNLEPANVVDGLYKIAQAIRMTEIDEAADGLGAIARELGNVAGALHRIADAIDTAGAALTQENPP